jgi:AraC family transcriptional regulator
MTATAAAQNPGGPTYLKTGMLVARIASDPPGVIEDPGKHAGPAIVIHLGPSVHIYCRRAGQCHSGVAVHGDIDIVPPGTPSRWEVKNLDTALMIGVQGELMRSVAEERGLDVRQISIFNRFQMRDLQIEHIGWALKAEMETGLPTRRLYADSLATALAVRLLEGHSSASRITDSRASMSGRKLRLVLSYIEDNLVQDLSLQELAAVAGIGLSQFKKVFRESVGRPVHRYVIERRVERAKMLLRDSRLPIAQIALDTGFAHQSHLARHVRQVTGLSPKAIREDAYRE